jgi:hypothetical protein
MSFQRFLKREKHSVLFVFLKWKHTHRITDLPPDRVPLYLFSLRV